MPAQPFDISALDAAGAHTLDQLLGICRQIEQGADSQTLTPACEKLVARGECDTLRVSVLAAGECGMRSAMVWLGVNARQAAEFAARRRDAVAQWTVGSPAVPDPATCTRRSNFNSAELKQLHVLAARPEALGSDQKSRIETFRGHGHLLLLADGEGGILTPAAVATVKDLLASFPYVIRARCGEASSPASWGGIVDASGACELPAPISKPEGGPAWLTDAADPTRRAMFLGTSLKTMGTIARDAAAQVDRLRRDVNSQLPAIGAAVRSGRPRKDERPVDVLRKLASQTILEIEDRINLENDRLIQPLGGLSRLVRDGANRIRVEDLSRMVGSQSVKLRLQSHQVSSYNRRLVDALQGQLRADIGQLDSELESLELRIAGQLSGNSPAPTGLKLPRLEFQRVWERIENLIDVGEEAEFELPRKSLFDLLGAGRQKVFFLIMFVALLGRMGIDEQVLTSFLPDVGPTVLGWLKSGFMVVLFSTCLGAMFNAILVWREEKDDQARKELDRIREAMIGDAQKVLDTAQKEKRAALRAYLKKVQEEIDLWWERAAEEQTARLDALQIQTQESQSALKQRDRELAGAADALQEVTEQVTRLESACDRLVRQGLAGLDAAPPLAAAENATSPRASAGEDKHRSPASRPTPSVASTFAKRRQARRQPSGAAAKPG